MEDEGNKYRIWYYCNVCGDEITIYPNSDAHKALIEYMKEQGWGHTECHEKKEGVKEQIEFDYSKILSNLGKTTTITPLVNKPGIFKYSGTCYRCGGTGTVYDPILRKNIPCPVCNKTPFRPFRPMTKDYSPPPRDSDHDGIPDYMDRTPFGPFGPGGY